MCNKGCARDSTTAWVPKIWGYRSATRGQGELLRLPGGRVNRVAARAHNLDALVGAQLLSDRALSQVRLPVHEACGWISGLGGDPHHLHCIVTGAVPKVGCDRKRADKDERRQHSHPPS